MVRHVEIVMSAQLAVLYKGVVHYKEELAKLQDTLKSSIDLHLPHMPKEQGVELTKVPHHPQIRTPQGDCTPVTWAMTDSRTIGAKP